MHSIIWTGRVLSRALWSGITNYSQCSVEPNVNKKRDSHLVSAVCGFPKQFVNARLRKGQFGDDAWFSAKFKTADVIGKTIFHYDCTFKKISISFFSLFTCYQGHVSFVVL